MTTLASVFESVAAIAKIIKELEANRTQSTVDRAVTEIQGQLLDLQGKLISVQAEYNTALNGMKEAKDKLDCLDPWAKKIGRYQLKEIAPGCFAYELRKDQANGDPIHLLCFACVHDQKMSILQRNRGADGILECLRNPDHWVSLETDKEGSLVDGD